MTGLKTILKIENSLLPIIMHCQVSRLLHVECLKDLYWDHCYLYCI